LTFPSNDSSNGGRSAWWFSSWLIADLPVIDASVPT
jgi:hypothetical protein